MLLCLQKTASHVLGKDKDSVEVKKLVKRAQAALDTDGDGKIERIENLKAMGELRRRSLLM